MIATEVPMASHTYVERGKGSIGFEKGTWTYQLTLNTARGGNVILNSQLENNIVWQNLMSGYKEDSYLISNGKGRWDQYNYSVHIDIEFQNGQINLTDYYKISNPVKVNRFNLPVNFSFQLNNKHPIGINILGIGVMLM